MPRLVAPVWERQRLYVSLAWQVKLRQRQLIIVIIIINIIAAYSSVSGRSPLCPSTKQHKTNSLNLLRKLVQKKCSFAAAVAA